MCFYALLVVLGFAQIRLRVLERPGVGLAGVTVRFEVGDLKSDRDGYVSGIAGGGVIRFSKDGYRPITKFWSDLSQKPEVTMVRDDRALWKPPLCTSPREKAVVSGWHMRFVVPAKLQSKRGSDIDYSTNNICRGSDCLQHGWGALWSFGTPLLPQKFLSDLNETAERDLYNLPNPALPGIEYRAVRGDGTYMRWVGVFGETISYDHVTKESAEMFDELIDTLCWIR
jgi:hypothetical protein